MLRRHGSPLPDRRRFAPASWCPLEDVLLPALAVAGALALWSTDLWGPLGTWLRVDRLFRGFVGGSGEITGAVTPVALAGLGLEIVPRQRWAPEPPRGGLAVLGRPTRITVHHEGGTAFRALDVAATARRIRAIQRYHQTARGWRDIGYHFVVDRAGRIWEGRPITARGAHAGNRENNAGNIGILVLGNFDLQEPTPAQEAALVGLLERCCALWEIPRRRVYTHNEIRVATGLVGTACPGRHLTAVVRRFRGGALPEPPRRDGG